MGERPLQRVVVAGGTGLVGRALVRALREEGAQVTVLSRRPAPADLPEGVTVRGWEHLPPLLEGADAVINLAGEGIADRRWSSARKGLLLRSRIQPTRSLVAAMAACAQRPAVLVNASAIGYYVPRGPEPVDEASAPGEGFLAALCQAWEAEAAAAADLGVREVRVRIGVVLAREGGALEKMARPVKAFLGSRLGRGTQGLSWIHLEDLVALLLQAARHPGWSGPVNGTAPEPLSQADFMRVLAARLRRPLLPVPAFATGLALRLALGQLATELLLQGAFVLPRAALAQGFRFRFPTAAAALEDLL